MNEFLDIDDEELNARIRSTLNAVADSFNAQVTRATSDARSYRTTMVHLSVAAMLALAMVGASFAWNSKDKKSDIALAAYAKPRELTKVDRETLIARCKEPVRKEFSALITRLRGYDDGMRAGFGPEEYPTFVDSRGPVSIAVYGIGNDVIVCSEQDDKLEVSQANFSSAFRMSFPMQVGREQPTATIPSGVFLTKGELAFQRYTTFGFQGILLRGGFETREVLHQFVVILRLNSHETPISVDPVTPVAGPGFSTSLFNIWLPVSVDAQTTHFVDKITATDWRGVSHILWDASWESVQTPAPTSTSVPNVEK